MNSEAEKCDQISVTFSEWVAVGTTAKNTSNFGYDLVHILGHRFTMLHIVNLLTKFYVR